MTKEKVILAYSGGLDTSVAITWLKKDYDVIAVCMDVGEGKDLDFIHDKALKVGALESYVLDVKDEFAENYVLPALQAHAMYEQKYPLVSALSRPIISKKLVEIAHKTGATTIAHGRVAAHFCETHIVRLEHKRKCRPRCAPRHGTGDEPHCSRRRALLQPCV